MSQMPEIDVSIIGNGEPAVGCGEPGGDGDRAGDQQHVIARTAIGARVRSLPITAEAVKAAMKAWIQRV